jgi:hypothetical protein
MNTSVIITPDSFTHSLPKQSFNDWWIQKIRHLTTAPFYKNSTKNKLSFIHVTNYIFHLSLFVAFFFPEILIPVLSIWLIKLITQFIVYNGAMKKLGEKDLLGFIIIFDMILLFIYPFLHLSRKIVKQNKWKT